MRIILIRKIRIRVLAHTTLIIINMSNLSTEVLYRIFSELPRFSHKQCLTVCKSWHPVAQASLNKHLKINNIDDLELLYKLFFQEPGTLKSTDIIRLTINESATDDYLSRKRTKENFTQILNQCVNLKELEFMGMNFTIYISNMYEFKDILHLNNLERIYIKKRDHLILVNKKYLQIIQHCCPKMKQMFLLFPKLAEEDVGNNDQVENNPSTFLKRFPALQHLEIFSENPISLKSILRDCPQLKALIIRQSICYDLKLQDTIVEEQDLIDSRLESFQIDLENVNQELCQCLFNNLTKLRELTIFGFHGLTHDYHYLPPDDTTVKYNILNNLEYAYKQNNTSQSIKTIRFEHFQDFAPETTTILGSCFPALKKVEFMDCHFDVYSDNGNNYTLDFGEMTLDCILLDVAFLFTGYDIEADKAVLEIVTPTNTFYYQREGKWKSGRPFDLRTTKNYSSASAIKKRSLDNRTGVVTIKINSLEKIHIECSIRKATFEQIIIIPPML